MHYLYMIKNNLDQLYIGISANPKRRIVDHNKKSGAEFTKSGRFEIVFLENYSNLFAARQREIQIKKWCRKKKEKLIEMYQEGKETRL